MKYKVGEELYRKEDGKKFILSSTDYIMFPDLPIFRYRLESDNGWEVHSKQSLDVFFYPKYVGSPLYAALEGKVNIPLEAPNIHSKPLWSRIGTRVAIMVKKSLKALYEALRTHLLFWRNTWK